MIIEYLDDHRTAIWISKKDQANPNYQFMLAEAIHGLSNAGYRIVTYESGKANLRNVVQDLLLHNRKCAVALDNKAYSEV